MKKYQSMLCIRSVSTEGAGCCGAQGSHSGELLTPALRAKPFPGKSNMWSRFVSLPRQLQQSALLGQLSIDFDLGRGAGRCICMGVSVFQLLVWPCAWPGRAAPVGWSFPRLPASSSHVPTAALGLRAVSACFVTPSVLSQVKNPEPCSLSRTQSSWKFSQRRGFSLGAPVAHEGN